MYECALLQNRKYGTPVIPVFVAEKDQIGNLVEFDFGKAVRTLPDVPHARKSRASNMTTQLRYLTRKEGRKCEREVGEKLEMKITNKKLKTKSLK
jgi:hypothetical protein